MWQKAETGVTERSVPITCRGIGSNPVLTTMYQMCGESRCRHTLMRWVRIPFNNSNEGGSQVTDNTL
jgi:hypothetical protein